MASLPYPLNRQDTHGRVGTARMPYPPTMSEKTCSSVFQSQQGFKSIGYHFVVRLDGEVERGRFPNAEIRGHRDYAAKDCPLHEHQDTNLHDKLKLLSLQISDEPHLL